MLLPLLPASQSRSAGGASPHELPPLPLLSDQLMAMPPLTSSLLYRLSPISSRPWLPSRAPSSPALTQGLPPPGSLSRPPGRSPSLQPPSRSPARPVDAHTSSCWPRPTERARGVSFASARAGRLFGRHPLVGLHRRGLRALIHLRAPSMPPHASSIRTGASPARVAPPRPSASS